LNATAVAMSRVGRELENDVSRINNSLQVLDKEVKSLNATTVDISKKESELVEDVSRINKRIGVLDSEVEKINVLPGVVDRVGQMEDDINNLESKAKKLVVCGYRKIIGANGAIRYNIAVPEVNEFGGVPLNKGNGKFTAPVTGLYEVSVAAINCYIDGIWAWQRVNLMVNDKEIERIME